MTIKLEPVKRAAAVRFQRFDSDHLGTFFALDSAVAHFMGSVCDSASPWGSASLHPRLYALTRYAGFTLTVSLRFVSRESSQISIKFAAGPTRNSA